MSRELEALDPSLADGPLTPTPVSRPLVSEQRVLLLNGPRPEMFDLTAGDVRPWENGPPITVPCESLPFALSRFSYLQIQLVRDLRASSTDLHLLSLSVGDSLVEVLDQRSGELALRGPGGQVTQPRGSSPAIVIGFRPTPRESGLEILVTVRNADSESSCSMTFSLPDAAAVLTIGGPSVATTGQYGRRRPSAVHIQAQNHLEAAGMARRVAGRLRREANSVLGRGS